MAAALIKKAKESALRGVVGGHVKRFKAQEKKKSKKFHKISLKKGLQNESCQKVRFKPAKT